MTRHRRSDGGVRWPGILAIVVACGGSPSTPPPMTDAGPTGVAQLTGSVAMHDFGFVGVNTPSSALSFVVTNVGDGPSASLLLRLEGANAAEFRYVVPQCANSLPPGESCTFAISLYPTSVGPRSARFVVTSGTVETSVMLLATSGIEADASITPFFWQPNAVHVGATSPEFTFTLTNDGDRATGDLVASLAGQSPQSFEITTNTCGVLAPSATCTIGVVFHATAAGVRNALLWVDGSPGGTATSSLRGTGTNDTFGITPPTHGFGGVKVNLRTVPFTFTVINTGTTTSEPLVTLMDGANPTEFGIENDGCTGVMLAAGATCTVGVHSYPAITGNMSANLRVTTATTGDGTAAVSATGLFDSTPPFFTDQSSLVFGAVPIGQQSGAQTITVTNLGFDEYSGALLTSLAGANAGQFAITNDGCDLVDLAPSATCTIGVRFQPTTAGSLAAELKIVGGGDRTRTVTLSGSGT